MVRVAALALRASGAVGQSAWQPPLRITPHRPATRAGAGTGARAPLLPPARSARPPAPRHQSRHGVIRFTLCPALHTAGTRTTATPTTQDSNQPPHHRDQPTTEPPTALVIDTRKDSGQPRTRKAGEGREEGGGEEGGERARLQEDASGGGAQTPGWEGRRSRVPAGAWRASWVAPIPTTFDPGRAEQSRPRASRSFVQWRAPP